MDTSLYEDFIRPLGEEYPAAINVSGLRVPLAYESRFKRHYLARTADAESHFDVSRFIDGTSSISLQRLKDEWHTWTDVDRADFCGSMRDLANLGHQDFGEIVRFLLQNADRDLLGPVVLFLPVGQPFSPDETFRLLVEVLQRSTPGHGADVIRALGRTAHPSAAPTICQHLLRLLEDPAVWADSTFFNKPALEAAYCVLSLLKLGAPAAEFEEILRRLSEHRCLRNREWVRRNFEKHYAWLVSPREK